MIVFNICLFCNETGSTEIYAVLHTLYPHDALPISGASLGYDNRGNLTSIGTNCYAYSSENLLTGGPGSAALAYDPLLRLDQGTKGTSATRFAYDGLDKIGRAHV